jgi:hypothetical protein
MLENYGRTMGKLWENWWLTTITYGNFNGEHLGKWWSCGFLQTNSYESY